jgi:CRISPR-associated endonuclease/helicase Cas3
MSRLTADDFSAFFQSLWRDELPGDRGAFPWQRRLMRTVAESGWPAVLDLPTGCGKTAVLDIAVFHLALQADAVSRRAPRRIVMVVDRRTIVDQTYERAQKIARKLSEAGEGVLCQVAAVLRSLTGNDGRAPIEAAKLRGGMYRDPTWARTPDQPLILSSTVDQIGSRLLFRGYGVSESMRPVHAGLLANDALIVLDECHLSRPFEQTLESLVRYRELAEQPIQAPWTVVRLSATPRSVGADEPSPFRLDADDRADPELARRLGARKSAELRPIPAKGEEAQKREHFAEECAAGARELLAEGARSVAVVVNRVDTARRVWEALAAGGGATYDVELLTGRMRPFDRDEVVGRIKKRVLAGGTRVEGERPIVVVATQSIEAGADFDFDALVTECASLPALRQRFGRLNRRGTNGRARAVILARKDALGKDDPVYAKALSATWSWLEAATGWDFGENSIQARLPEGDELRRLSESGSGDFWLEESPILLPAHLDSWVQTSPGERAAEPDVALWLHGASGTPADVQIVWRADVSEEDLQEGGLDRLRDILAACPPCSGEAMSVPFHAARNWLDGEREPDVVDVEGGAGPDDDVRGAIRAGSRRALRWRGDGSELVNARGLTPGDTIVVPTSYGGVGLHGNWDPRSKRAPVDLGDVLQLRERGCAVVRLHADAFAGLSQALKAVTGVDLIAPPPPSDDATPHEERRAVGEWIEGCAARLRGTGGTTSSELVGAALETFEALSDARAALKIVTPGGPTGTAGRVVVAARRRRQSQANPPSTVVASVGTEVEDSSFTGISASLADHSKGVKEWARRFARNCRLPDFLARDLCLAAWLHDIGKADPRFQAWLRGGHAVGGSDGDELLAKSRVPALDRASRERARVSSGYPRGTRHEMLSVALADAQPELRRRAGDWDLVLHLVASHHGHARPFAPPLEDSEDLDVSLVLEAMRFQAGGRHRLARLDSPVADRFWRCVRRYGWFGVAWLEAIMRLADHRRSEEEVEVTQ